MKIATFFGIAATALLVAGSVGADEASHLSHAIAGGVIKVTPDSGWHLNKDYPNWSLTVGDKKLAKGDFDSLDEHAAVIHAPKGHAVLKGAVCSEDGQQCKSIKHEFDVN